MAGGEQAFKKCHGIRVSMFAHMTKTGMQHLDEHEQAANAETDN